MRTMIAVLVTVVVGLASVPHAQAQYFRFDSNYSSSSQVEEGVAAVLKMFGTVVGGGLYHTADLHSVAGVDVGLRGVVANVPEEFKDLPVFADEDYVGLAFLHGSVGLPGNFEVLGRFFYFPLGAESDGSINRADSRGGVTLIGGGLKYGLISGLGLPSITVIGAYHALFVPSEFDFGTVGTATLKAVASYSIPFFTVYLGGGFDHTRLSLDDDLPFPDLAGESFNETIPTGTVGIQVRPLPLVYVNGAYTVSEFKAFDLGVGISFR